MTVANSAMNYSSEMSYGHQFSHASVSIIRLADIARVMSVFSVFELVGIIKGLYKRLTRVNFYDSA